MDVDKLKKWLDVAQQFQGDHFWSDIFESSNPMQGANPNTEQPNPKINPVPKERNTTEHVYHSTYSEDQTPKNEPPNPPQPAVDIFETDTEWILWIDLPGIHKSDIQLNLVGRRLIIKGVAHTPFPDDTLIHSERLNGTFERSINMPDNLTLNIQPNAKYKDGVLEVRLSRDKPKKHQIAID